MYSIALIMTALAASALVEDKPHQPRSSEEPVFGIAFSMENIMMSVALPGGHEKGLAAVKGDRAYQNLMMSYYELCYWAHDSQVPLWGYGEHNETMATEYQGQQISTADMDWYDWYNRHIIGYVEAAHDLLGLDGYANDTDVDVLAKVVEDVKRAATDVLASQYGIMVPGQPFVSIAAPSFMWTDESGPCEDSEEHQDCESLSDTYSSSWNDVFTLKMSDAVNRAGFRREIINNIDMTMQANECQNHTSPIAPAGYAAFWNPSFQFGEDAASHEPAASFGVEHEGQPAIVAELTNVTLSFWAQQKGPVWSPWSIKPQLGVETNQDLPAYMRYPNDSVWSSVVSMIRQLRRHLGHPDGELLNVYFTGDAWEGEMVDDFKAYLRNKGHTDLNVEFRGMFAASDGAASFARRMLNACGP